MLSHLVCVAMLAISFHEILCYYLPGNITMPDSLLQDCEITLVISPVASIRNHYASCQGQLIHKQVVKLVQHISMWYYLLDIITIVLVFFGPQFFRVKKETKD